MLKTAVIGCGAVSKNHGKALSGNAYTTLEYCVDIDRERAEAFSKTYGGTPLTDYRDLYGKDIDAVHVITPHNTHPTIVMDLLDHGFNVFCEKPLAITVNEAKQMIRKSEETGKLLGVCFQNRLNRASVEAKEILDSGKYGRILRMCRTPTADEYKKTLVIVTAGLALLGVVGYAIYWLMSYLPGYF